MPGALVAVLLALTGAAAAPDFSYIPQPRWGRIPGHAGRLRGDAGGMRCPAQGGQIDTEWGYAELYNADGMLIGLRSVQSSRCKPLDEHLLLSRRHFATTFIEAGKPDLDDITVELALGTPKEAVRLVKRGSTQVSIGC